LLANPLAIANDLAADLHALGEHEAARRLAEDILARARRVFGDDHPRTRRAADVLRAARGTDDKRVCSQAGDAEPH
jgi:hypothetical protein